MDDFVRSFVLDCSAGGGMVVWRLEVIVGWRGLVVALDSFSLCVWCAEHLVWQ